MKYMTKKYKNNQSGISKKNADAQQYAMLGWRIISESIEPGRFKGADACCLGAICLPCAFMAGSTEGNIIVTYGLEESICPSNGSPELPPTAPINSQVGKEAHMTGDTAKTGPEERKEYDKQVKCAVIIAGVLVIAVILSVIMAIVLDSGQRSKSVEKQAKIIHTPTVSKPENQDVASSAEAKIQKEKVEESQDKEQIEKAPATSVKKPVKPKWEIGRRFGMITTVWISKDAVNDRHLIAQIIRDVTHLYGNRSVIWFFNDKRFVPEGVPMTDSQMLHWVGKYSPGKSDTFFYIKVTNRRTSPPGVKEVATDIRPAVAE